MCWAATISRALPWSYGMKVVKVYGALRKYLGQCRFQFEADTPAQAIKALCVNFPGLDKWLLDSEQDGVAYRVTIGKEKITEDDLSPLVMPWSERQVFSITPVIAGAGGGLAKIGIGIGLVAFAILTAGAGAPVLGIAGAGGGIFGSAFTLGIVAANAIAGIGISLALSGVAQLISPQQTYSSAERGKEAARFESFTFSGITNTAQQGLPVPICYGRAFIGSSVISSGLDVDQLV
jgi:predicted phage tail protein